MTWWGRRSLTAESDFLLELGVMYTVTDPKPDAAVLVVESRDNGLQFTPKAPTGGNDVSVTLTQPAADVTDSQGVVIGHAGGSLSFPVDIKPASGAPTTVNIPNQSILRGGQPTRLNLASLFQREDLTYTATSSRENFATVEIDQVTQELVITTLRAGVTVITVTATDVNRGKATDTFRLTVVSPNKPPEVVGNVPDQTLFLDDAGTQLDMTPYFRDGDGDLLRFIPQSSNPRVVTASSSGGAITFNVISLGEVRMTVLAEDPEGVTAFVTFTVTVLPPNIAPEAVGEIPAQTLRLGDPAVALNLAPFFTDADGDPLTFTTGTADGSNTNGGYCGQRCNHDGGGSRRDHNDRYGHRSSRRIRHAKSCGNGAAGQQAAGGRGVHWAPGVGGGRQSDEHRCGRVLQRPRRRRPHLHG